MSIAQAGTIESSDCLVTVKHDDGIKIVIESTVFDAFGDQIEAVIKKTLSLKKIENIYVHIQDKGALDYAIEARLLTALKRLGVIHA
jgi:citrate lyase subunit gamma (acyl carrier protein)